jgi:hypothetical protein
MHQTVFSLLALAGLPTFPIAAAEASEATEATNAQQASQPEHQPFHGWRDLTTWRLPSGKNTLYVADTHGDARHEIMLLNRRQARLDIFSAKTPENQQPTQTSAAVNRLLLPAWLNKTTLICEGVPVVAAVLPQQAGIAVVTNPNMVVSLFTRDEQGTWTSATIGRLNRGRINTNARPFVWENDLYVPMQNGLQKISLATKNARATWLLPKQGAPATAVELIDINNDATPEIVEFLGSGEHAVRIWSYDPAEQSWQPPQRGLDRALRSTAVLPLASGALFAGVETNQQEQVRLYRWQTNPDATYHFDEVLLPGKRAPLAGITINDQSYLISIAPKSAELFLWHTKQDAGWQQPQRFPFPTGVSQVSTLTSDNGPTCLAWRAEHGDLLHSTWNGERFTYPQALTPPEPIPPQATVLRSGRIGQTVWALWQHEDDLFLVQWTEKLENPSVLFFNDVGDKITDATWLGNELLLAREKFAKGSLLITAAAPGTPAAKRTHDEVPLLKNVNVKDVRVLPRQGTTVMVHIANGIAQLLDHNLKAIEQWQLPEGQPLSSLVFTGNDTATALSGDGSQLFELQATQSGIPTITASYDLEQTQWLHHDPVLGIVMGRGERAWRLRQGPTDDLVRVDDLSAPSPPDVGEPEAHRLFSLPAPANNIQRPHWLVLSDDRFQQLSLVTIDQHGQHDVAASWPVFEDDAYPYGENAYDEADFTTEPEEIHAGDLTGDGHDELIMICHDRCLVYLSEDPALRQEGE